MSFTDTLHLVMFTTGLAVGFGHCLGMCGPIVVSLSLSRQGKGGLLPHLLYQSGRITTYAILGGVAGASGSFVATVGSIPGLQKGVLILAGVILALLGAGMTGWLNWGARFVGNSGNPGLFARAHQKLAAAAAIGCYPLGLILGLLPCGPVYTALLAATRAAMEAGSAGRGAVTGAGLMLAFGMGTVPALILVAKLANMGWLTARERLYRAAAVIMVAVGLYFIYRGIRY